MNLPPVVLILIVLCSIAAGYVLRQWHAIEEWTAGFRAGYRAGSRSVDAEEDETNC